MDWAEVGAWSPADFVRDLQGYIADDAAPIYPRDDNRAKHLHEFLYRERPDPRALLPLFGPHGPATEVTPRLQKRDLIGFVVVTSFARRLFEHPHERWRAELYDVLARAGVHFSFDPVYGDGYTYTGIEVGDFFSQATFPVCEESRAAVRRTLPDYLRAWRGRANDRASSSFFGIVLRHLGTEGARVLCGEWKNMTADERTDLLARFAHEDALPRAARETTVEGLFDEEFEVRDAAFAALKAHGAPLDGLDLSARDADREAARPRLARWAAETES